MYVIKPILIKLSKTLFLLCLLMFFSQKIFKFETTKNILCYFVFTDDCDK